MQRLFNIIRDFKEYVVLALLIVASLLLLSLNDNTQVRAIRSYTVALVGVLQDAVSVLPNFFALQRENELLRQLNVNLSDEVSRLREARLENIRLRELLGLKERLPFRLVPADVVGKSLHLQRNTITINAGSADGISPDMPIICETGLVGRIVATSSRYSIGRLVLNVDSRASAKVQRSRIVGILAWEGGELLQLRNVSRMDDVVPGDLVITSGYGSMFPPNIKIGIVALAEDEKGGLFKRVLIKPSVDFTALEQVFVIAATVDSERVALEETYSKRK
jgi:rod shape-determining protein MreC